MKLSELISSVEADVLTVQASRDAEISGIYAGDRISDLLNHGTAETLLVTNLTGVPVLRVAELMEVAALCLLNGIHPGPGLIRAAEEHGAAVLVSPFNMFETCGRLFECFDAVSEMRR